MQAENNSESSAAAAAPAAPASSGDEEGGGGGGPAPSSTSGNEQPSSSSLPVPVVVLQRASELQPLDAASRLYWDRSHYQSPEDQVRALHQSSTVYVGNLAFTTRSRHVAAFFAQLGSIHEIHMGLDRVRKKPCGFCFVQYRKRADALQAVAVLSGSKLDGNVVRVELDAGFHPGRQYGRGRFGGQVRDDKRAIPSGGGIYNSRSYGSHKRTLEQARHSNDEPAAAAAGDEGERYGRTDDPMDDNNNNNNDDNDNDNDRPSKRQRT